MKQRAWFLTDTGVVAVAAALSLIVLVESFFPPWAPYFIVYAVLAIALPLAWKTYAFGSLRTVLRSHWRITLLILLLAVALNTGFSRLYQGLLNSVGLGADVFYSLDLALEALAARAGTRFGIDADSAMLIYAAFILLWAPIGEELFYRGYVQGVLRGLHAFGPAMWVSAAFFGLRHATHLFFFMAPGALCGRGQLGAELVPLWSADELPIRENAFSLPADMGALCRECGRAFAECVAQVSANAFSERLSERQARRIAGKMPALWAVKDLQGIFEASGLSVKNFHGEAGQPSFLEGVEWIYALFSWVRPNLPYQHYRL